MRRAVGPQDMASPNAVAVVHTVEALLHRAPKTFEHVQVLPATQWVVDHELDFDPAGIVVRDDSGATLEGWTVSYDVPGAQLRILLEVPLAGTAYFS